MEGWGILLETRGSLWRQAAAEALLVGLYTTVINQLTRVT